MPSKARLLAKSMIESPILSEITTNPTVTPTTITSSINTAVDDVATGNFASIDLLPNTGNDVGDLAFVQATDRLYIWSGEGWYNIALVNTTPTWDSGGQPAGSYVLDADSPQTATIITLAASDPEGFPVSYNYVTSGSMDSIATISQDSSVFTITPKTSTQAPDGGTGTITFRATDGTNILPQVSSFTLTFPVDWSSITEQSALKASDAAASNNFGESVAIAKNGNTAISGARLNTNPTHQAGAAYIYTLSGSSWSQQAKLVASDKNFNQQFGTAVSLSEDGNIAIVGAPYSDNLPQTSSSGAAYVYTRSGSTWSQQAKLSASDGADSYFFGCSVSITDDGNTAIVGARLDGGTNYGAAYIFTRSGSTWSQQTKLTASDAATDDEFGWSVSISGSDGNTAIVSSPKEDTGATSAGSAYIFTRSGSTWSQQAKIQASNRGSNDLFGYGINGVSISGDGDTVIVGAVNEDTNGTDAGAAYVFTRSGTTWSQQAMIKASDAASSDKFGSAVSISEDGDTSVVGASNESGTGAAYIFTRSGTSWTQVNKIQASNAQSGDEFGSAISISNKSVIVGAYQEDTTATNSGSAYIFS
jgi:hypothetical protein